MSEAAMLESLLTVLRQVCGSRSAALHEPEFNGQERAYVLDCIDTGWVSTAGAYVDRFERMLESHTGAAHAISCVNGTAALHMCMVLAGVQPGDEVLVPSFTFVATANAVSHAGAVPHFLDCTPDCGVDAAAIRAYLAATVTRDGGLLRNRHTGRRIAALVVMHVFGHPADLDGINAVAREFGLPLIEDAAESLGSTYKGRHTGNHGLVSALSFNGNKVATTGGGGAILTNDPDLARRAKHLTTTARVPAGQHFIHDQIGWNYRMPNINAALGCAQLETLPGKLQRKRRLAEAYREAFAPLQDFRFLTEPMHGSSNFWLNAVLLSAGGAEMRDRLIQAVNAAGYQVRPAWTPMHLLPIYAHCPRMNLPNTEDIFARLINLPSSPQLIGHA